MTEHNRRETDPNGRDLNSTGAKGDAGKMRPALVLGGFSRALLAVTAVGTRGANKYTDYGFLQVPNGVSRYDEAKLRHWMYERAGKVYDDETGYLHAAHEAWNALARLELICREADLISQRTGAKPTEEEMLTILAGTMTADVLANKGPKPDAA